MAEEVIIKKLSKREQDELTRMIDEFITGGSIGDSSLMEGFCVDLNDLWRCPYLISEHGDDNCAHNFDMNFGDCPGARRAREDEGVMNEVFKKWCVKKDIALPESSRWYGGDEVRCDEGEAREYHEMEEEEMTIKDKKEQEICDALGVVLAAYREEIVSCMLEGVKTGNNGVRVADTWRDFFFDVRVGGLDCRMELTVTAMEPEKIEGWSPTPEGVPEADGPEAE